ncbi:MAG: hypothetical protein V9E98_07405 [Candidatus Nanopelagicales bacterium]
MSHPSSSPESAMGAAPAEDVEKTAPQTVHLDDLLTPGDEALVASERSGVSRPPAPTAVNPPASVVSAVATPAAAPATKTSWRARLARRSGAGVKVVKESPPVLSSQRQVIETARWSRPMNVAVLNLKGGSAKTPTALALAGVLAFVRGGGVAVVEACEATGTLALRAEGSTDRGLSELLAAADQVPNAVALSMYMQRQTSHADVLADADRRSRVLTGDDVTSFRRVIDHFYSMSVTDTSINPASGAWQAAVKGADVAVLPVTYSSDAIAGAASVLDILRAGPSEFSDPESGLIARTVVVLNDSGVRVSPETSQRVTAALASLGVPVLTVPFEPALQDGEIHLNAFNDASQAAWTAVTAAVVEMCSSADPGSADVGTTRVNTA